MRSALLALVVIAALLATSLSVAAQTPDTDTPVTDTPIVDEPVFDQPLADQDSPVDQDSPDATSTPAVIYAVVTATPTPTVAPATYTTRNGPKSEQDLRTELARAGYQGPWDLGALLTAYDRATMPTPTPVPTISPTMARCQALAPTAEAFFSNASNTVPKAAATNDYATLRATAATIRARTYPPEMLPMVNALLRALDWSAGAAEIRANWVLLIAAAQNTGNPALVIAAAQSDLARDDGQASAAMLDFQNETQKFIAACSR